MRMVVRELRDLAGYWLLPVLSALLPWAWCWQVYRRAAGWSWLYRPECQAMERGLQKLAPDGDTRLWPSRFRLGWLVEQADLFLFLFKPARHLRRCWRTPEGQWPDERPWITAFFNFGFGLLVLEQMRQAGFHPSLVYAPAPDRRPPGMSFSRFAYMRLRQRAMEKACEQRAIPTGGAWERIQQAIRDQRTVVVVADAPARAGNRTVEVELFGHTGQWRRGVPEMILQSGLPTVVFRVRLDWTSGQRQLVLHTIPPCTSMGQLVEQLRAVFHQGMREHPETWLYWTALEVFIPALADTVGDQQEAQPPG